VAFISKPKRAGAISTSDNPFATRHQLVAPPSCPTTWAVEPSRAAGAAPPGAGGTSATSSIALAAERYVEH
jgi:hypothetical protein